MIKRDIITLAKIDSYSEGIDERWDSVPTSMNGYLSTDMA